MVSERGAHKNTARLKPKLATCQHSRGLLHSAAAADELRGARTVTVASSSLTPLYGPRGGAYYLPFHTGHGLRPARAGQKRSAVRQMCAIPYRLPPARVDMI